MSKIKRVVSCSMGGNRHHAERLWKIIKGLGAKLRIISEWESNPEFPEIEYVKWDLATYRQNISECDVAIAPQDVELQPAKSANKVLMYMSLGIPVVASSLPAYKEIVVTDHNGYIVNTDQEWQDCINVLLFCTEEFRQRIIDNAFETIKPFSPDAIAGQWVNLFKDIAGYS